MQPFFRSKATARLSSSFHLGLENSSVNTLPRQIQCKNNNRIVEPVTSYEVSVLSVENLWACLHPLVPLQGYNSVKTLTRQKIIVGNDVFYDERKVDNLLFPEMPVVSHYPLMYDISSKQYKSITSLYKYSVYI
jgi:hypothetical protein